MGTSPHSQNGSKKRIIIRENETQPTPTSKAQQPSFIITRVEKHLKSLKNQPPPQSSGRKKHGPVNPVTMNVHAKMSLKISTTFDNDD